jgi:ABC transport system ATP-binding/permease protein
VATSVLMAEGQGRFVEYAGGYSDMVAQRGAGVSARVRERETPKAAKAAPAPRAIQTERRKLSFKDKHALETLPAQITALEREIHALSQRLSAGDFYERDPKGFAAASAKLAELHASLAASEERWLELEMLREELER